MGVLSFDGTDDKLKWTSLTATLADVTDGAWTMVALFKRGSASSYDAVGYLLSGAGAGVVEAGFSFRDPTHDLYMDSVASPTPDSPSVFTSTTNIYLFALSKGAGTVAPRLAWKANAAGSWTHENLTQTCPDQIDSTMLEIGAWQGADPYHGHIGLIAFYEGAMSDGDKEALDNNWRTSDLWTSAHGQPKFLAELNVAGASVVDLAGNASTLTATGTTLDAAQTLDSWNFDGTGAAATTSFPFPAYRQTSAVFSR